MPSALIRLGGDVQMGQLGRDMVRKLQNRELAMYSKILNTGVNVVRHVS